ncbi:hypothetical protein G8759_25185 [Spirosoma aureum]|uniref:Uncharacterized protein n=1 Tax=Spirosoma aureum TaxID=2692134 RepID=A0A6G9AT86_9BACT|nr:DUF6712 family protein [Spirosoma aureum]QIP15691.1 hypothetical protein G8759_25185 [Spirosoma aureum]
MTTLFTGDTGLFRQFVSVNRNFTMADVLPSLQATAETLLPRFLGDELADQITSRADNPLPENPTADDLILNKALFWTRSIVAKLGFATNLIFSELQIDNDGITVSANEGRRAAFDYQTKELKRTLQEQGWQALDELLKLISKNPALFPGWEDSPYYTQYQNALFGNPVEFSKYYPIQDRWLTYWALIPFMADVADRMGEPALARIEALPNTVNETVRGKLKRSLLRALAYEVMIQAVPGLSIEVVGANVQLNYASQYGGKESYYTPPGRELLDWVLGNLKGQVAVFWENFENAIAVLEPSTDPDLSDDALGLIDSEGPFVMI